MLNHERHHWLELTNQLWKAKETGREPATVLDEYTVKLDPARSILSCVAGAGPDPSRPVHVPGRNA